MVSRGGVRTFPIALPFLLLGIKVVFGILNNRRSKLEIHRFLKGLGNGTVLRSSFLKILFNGKLYLLSPGHKAL